jgi:beta-lactamase class A
LECAELPESVSDDAIEKAKESLAKIIDSSTKAGNISYASVYFRDLNNGPWFGINESDKFFPASLLKLPLAMSFYDKSEEDTALLSRQIAYKADPSVTSQLQPFGGPDQLQDGQAYTVQYLLDLMLKESNNEAANALAQYGGMPLIDNVYHDLGLTLPQPGQDYKIDTHKYASFFRILYNATYVDRTASEAILKTLTDTSFNQGLNAGVPANTVVSHKFGTRQVSDNTVQLHDCGIIYAPNKPYVLCVMTQGSDFTKLANFIKDASAAVYNAVINDKP